MLAPLSAAALGISSREHRSSRLYEHKNKYNITISEKTLVLHLEFIKLRSEMQRHIKFS